MLSKDQTRQAQAQWQRMTACKQALVSNAPEVHALNYHFIFQVITM